MRLGGFKGQVFKLFVQDLPATFKLMHLEKLVWDLLLASSTQSLIKIFDGFAFVTPNI